MKEGNILYRILDGEDTGDAFLLVTQGEYTLLKRKAYGLVNIETSEYMGLDTSVRNVEDVCKELNLTLVFKNLEELYR